MVKSFYNISFLFKCGNTYARHYFTYSGQCHTSWERKSCDSTSFLIFLQILGKIVFFTEGLLFIHSQYGSITLSKDHISAIKFYSPVIFKVLPCDMTCSNASFIWSHIYSWSVILLFSTLMISKTALYLLPYKTMLKHIIWIHMQLNFWYELFVLLLPGLQRCGVSLCGVWKQLAPPPSVPAPQLWPVFGLCSSAQV